LKGFKSFSREEKRVSRERLFEIRKVLNDHREYQGLSVAVWKLRAE
jgi:hypothetical protein